MTMRKFDKDEIMDMDFKAYIASSSEEEEGNETTQINAESAGKIENAEKEDMDNEDARVEKYKVCHFFVPAQTLQETPVFLAFMLENKLLVITTNYQLFSHFDIQFSRRFAKVF